MLCAFEKPTPQMIQEARRRLQDVARETPTLASSRDPKLFYKTESLQVTGSFKVRPAYNQLVHLPGPARARGVVTSSSGNFAQGAAYAARRLGIEARIVMMRSSNPLKVKRTRELGAEVVFCEDRFEARQAKVQEILDATGCSVIYPYDHPLAIAGNGTIAEEILEQLPDTKNIVVPESGGGLISGIALAAKLRNPKVRIWGIQAAGSNAAYLSFQKGERCSIPKANTVADGLAVTIPGELTFPLMVQYVDALETVEEETILPAVKHLLEEDRLLVEPSGAVTLAAVLEGTVPVDQTVLVLSGGNISPTVLNEAVRAS